MQEKQRGLREPLEGVQGASGGELGLGASGGGPWGGSQRSSKLAASPRGQSQGQGPGVV